jgi:hypothetical protein
LCHLAYAFHRFFIFFIFFFFSFAIKTRHTCLECPLPIIITTTTTHWWFLKLSSPISQNVLSSVACLLAFF